MRHDVRFDRCAESGRRTCALVVLAVCEKIRTYVCADLGSTFELEHDLRCFEHVLTYSNRLV